jgi:regulator of RNase E activity RraB
MMATKWLAKVANGTYTDKSGQEKTSWLTIGKVIEQQNGSLTLKLDCVPVAFDGWVQFFDPPKDDDKPQRQFRQNGKADDIPF